MNLSRLVNLVKNDLKMSFREPGMVFLLLLFPIMFTVICSVAFGGMDAGGTTSFAIGVVNLDNPASSNTWTTSFVGNLTQENATHIIYYETNSSAQAALLNGDLDALIVIPDGFGASIDSYWSSPGNVSEWTNTTLALYIDS
ncbi:MAG: ABC transporter permease, partial [Candidatus Ranarchaeia archaeon]